MNLDLPQIGGECQGFTRWWNSEGQFLQPIGDMQSEYGLDFAKKIAESVFCHVTDYHDDLRQEIESRVETIEQEAERAKERAKDFLRDIEEIIENEEVDHAKLDAIEDKIRTYEV